MAFQGKQPFLSFLQSSASAADLEDTAPAENWILDERVPNAREDTFLAHSGFDTAAAEIPLWFKRYVDYAKANVSLPSVSETFQPINSGAWLALSPDWDVVRIETLSGLTECANRKGSTLTEGELMPLIREFVNARAQGSAIDPLKNAQLQKWLNLVNDGRDRRPAFVAPFADVEVILQQGDWADRLRDALGLGHIRSTGSPMTVLLMQYNLIRVHNAHIGKPAWAASPTILDDVPGQMPNPCFFPAPKSVSTAGYGFTVDLSTSNRSYRKEFLHAKIPYTLDDIHRIGEVTTDVPPALIEKARKDHRVLLEADLVHFGDLP